MVFESVLNIKCWLQVVFKVVSCRQSSNANFVFVGNPLNSFVSTQRELMTMNNNGKKCAHLDGSKNMRIHVFAALRTRLHSSLNSDLHCICADNGFTGSSEWLAL